MDTQISTYASVLSKENKQTENLSNNNPVLHPETITTDKLNDSASIASNENSANIDDNKNSNFTTTSSSLNESFEDAEDGYLNTNSSRDMSEELKGDPSTVSEVTLNSSERVMEMNESSSVDNSEEESDVDADRSDLDSLYPTALKWKFRSTNVNLNLPQTVTLLENEFGSKVYIVGTAHFSQESQEDVAKTIRAVQPDSVMLELCKSRVNMLSLDEATILEEAKGLTFQKIAATIEQNGVLQGALYFLLLSMSAHLTKQLGMAPGGEFRRAYNEAQQIPGCVIHLGDRPIHITLQRALGKLSLWQKIRIAWHMLRSKGPISKEEVERCKQKDLLEEMLAEMTGEFPELSQVFVTERDKYLAYSLQMAALPMLSPRSPDIPTPTTVVGVVGIGHVAGITENWGKVQDEDIPPILCIPEPTMSSKVLRHTIRISLLGLGIYGFYKIFPRSFIPSKPRITSLFNSVF